ncbi:CoA transferase [Mesorhizobium sp. CAU 1741]|uniref:CaiB/BaiF CoA transferase family protein n=1 Tax=Mesorhizobium sp. CAU 1741 TaxID=3140366 RepID=UPI00325AC9F0
MMKFLDGVKVVEIGHILMAPYATQFLGDFGADVIKVESLDGDYYRQLGLGRKRGMTAQWMSVNRNKRSISLDLKDPEARETLNALLRDADIVVHNMRVKAIERLGLGYDAVKALNPKVVYCAAIGFGQDGPYADFPAFDDIIQAYSGLAAVNGVGSGKPTFLPLAIVDKVVALMLGQAMLAGLHRQRATGKGCYIETPMFEAAVTVVLNQHLNGHSYVPAEAGLGYKRVMSPHRQPAPTKDGYIVHGVYKFEHWRRFLTETGRQDVLDGPLMADQHAMANNIAGLYQIAAQEILPTRTTAEWRALFDELDIPSAPVLQMEDLENDPHLKAVGLFEEYDHPSQGRLRWMRAPFTVRDVETSADRHPPEIGEHSLEVLREVGLTDEQIEALHARGVIRDFSEQPDQATRKVG